MSMKNLNLVCTTGASMLVASSTVAVNSTALVSLRNATLYDPVPLVIVNTGAVPLYLGGLRSSAALTSAFGTPVPSSGNMSFTLFSDALFAHTSGTTCAFSVTAGRQY